MTFEDRALFPNIVDELRDVAVRDMVPAGYGPPPPTPMIYESGGTTGAPKRVIFLRHCIEHVTARLSADLDEPTLRNGGLPVPAPPQPPIFRQLQRPLARPTSNTLFDIDQYPRSVK